jgi:hypothetical protein
MTIIYKAAIKDSPPAEEGQLSSSHGSPGPPTDAQGPDCCLFDEYPHVEPPANGSFNVSQIPSPLRQRGGT